jgi:hypothetical protein
LKWKPISRHAFAAAQKSKESGKQTCKIELEQRLLHTQRKRTGQLNVLSELRCLFLYAIEPKKEAHQRAIAAINPRKLIIVHTQHSEVLENRSRPVAL